ncbi:MAG: class I SAM-dependent methyltransferase [Aurantibacter sp.]
MRTKTTRFKKNFAGFQAKYDEESYQVHKTRKSELFSEVEGTVLEIGPGTGVNFLFLENHPVKWIGIEPNPAMHPYLLEAAAKQSIPVSLLECYTENICLPDSQVDYVISTEVLCSVTDLHKSLLEIKRVLKPDGKFLFLEHVVDKKNLVRRAVQKTVPYTPWKCFSDGCNPGRDIGAAIENVGFSDVRYTNYLREVNNIITMINRPHIYGWAIK